MACQKFKTFRCLKTQFKVYTTTRRNAFIVDLFKNFIGFENVRGGDYTKECIYSRSFKNFIGLENVVGGGGGLKFPKTLRYYGSGLWKANQKDNGIDQNILQYCYGHDKLYL